MAEHLSQTNELVKEKRNGWSLSRLSRFGPLLVLLLLILLVGLFERSFLRPSNLRVVMEGATPILLLALGQTFVILVGGIDLSNAAIASLAGLIVAFLLPDYGAFAVLLAAFFGLAAGALQGFVHDIGQVPSLIVTLIGLSVWSGIALAISDGQTVRPEAGIEIITWLAERHFVLRSGLIVTICLVAAFGWFLRSTTMGRRLIAVGSDQLVALLSGIPVRRIRIVAFGLSGLFGALAGILLLGDLGTASPTVAQVLLLPSLAAVLMGGTSITGGSGGTWQTLIGSAIIGVLRIAFNAIGLDPAVHQLFYGLIILVALALSVDRSQQNQ